MGGNIEMGGGGRGVNNAHQDIGDNKSSLRRKVGAKLSSIGGRLRSVCSGLLKGSKKLDHLMQGAMQNSPSSSPKLDQIKKKNLAIFREGTAEQKMAKMTIAREVFGDSSEDANAKMVFRERQVKKSRDLSVDKSNPSDWYRKTDPQSNEEMLVAPIYSVFIPGSPQVRHTQHEGRDNYAYKGVKGCSNVDVSDIRSGNLSGVARCALFAKLAGYSDRSEDNALKDEHGRMVLIDYESNFHLSSNWESFFSNPLANFRDFVSGTDDEKDNELQKLQSTDQFSQEMKNAMLLLAVFPKELLEAPIKARRDAFGIDANSPVSGFENAQARFKTALTNTETYWKKDVQDLIKDKTDEQIADQLIEEIAHSSILREMDPEGLKNKLVENIAQFRRNMQ